jgi:hypothetical protein
MIDLCVPKTQNLNVAMLKPAEDRVKELFLPDELDETAAHPCAELHVF